MSANAFSLTRNIDLNESAMYSRKHLRKEQRSIYAIREDHSLRPQRSWSMRPAATI
jgi:hypothetical protein